MKVLLGQSHSPGWNTPTLVCYLTVSNSRCCCCRVSPTNLSFMLSILGKPDVKTVQPFTKVDLSQIPFQEIIRNFQILEADNVPENPLLYLYPNTPRNEAFGKYYTEKSGGKGTTCCIRYIFLATAAH